MLTRNVACENDRYGFHFQITKSPGFDPVLYVRQPDGTVAARDVRTIPLLRFEDNESHGDGLFGFRFGDELQGTVHGDREHPFIVRNLRVWAAHYAIRPNVQFFLLDGLRVKNAAFGIYHPNYDTHVYRQIAFDRITQEPLNGGHDEDSLPFGNFTFDGLAFINCQLGRDPLIQLTVVGPAGGLSGHFRGVSIKNSNSNSNSVVDFGGGPRTNKIEHPVSYYFYDTPAVGTVTRVGSSKIPAIRGDNAFQSSGGWTGPDALAAVAKDVAFPELLWPVDDQPPATLITQIRVVGHQRIVSGVSHDNGEVALVTVNGQPASIVAQQAGIADWTITLDAPADGHWSAHAQDRDGNQERMPHELATTPTP